MPSWFSSIHSNKREKPASPASMIPSPLPPFSGLSNSERDRNPFGIEVLGWGVWLPKSSVPLSIVPLPLRSRARKALRDPAAVQAICTGLPSPRMSKCTPFCELVSAKPWPVVSMMIGLPRHCKSELGSHPDGGGGLFLIGHEDQSTQHCSQSDRSQ